MATKYKVKTKAVINRHPVGSTIELNEDTAKRLAKMKYVEIIEEVKPPVKKSTSATKKPEAKRTQSKKEDNVTDEDKK